MRDLICHALTWVLQRLLPGHGKHGADGETSTAPRPAPETSTLSHSTAPAIEWTEPAQPSDEDEIFWDTPLVRRYLEVYEDEVRRTQEDDVPPGDTTGHDSQEARRQHHRRAALRAAVAGWDYPDALYITPGTGLRTVQVQRSSSGTAVLA